MAARLENMNKEFGTCILLSESTADQIAGPRLKRIGSVDIRGQSGPHEVFTVEDK
jgi:class 3 adenylate cyclase